MEVVTRIIAVIALVLVVAAFVRTGGIHDLRGQLGSVASKTETSRDRTADALDRLERLIRGEEKPEGSTESGPGDALDPDEALKWLHGDAVSGCMPSPPSA